MIRIHRNFGKKIYNLSKVDECLHINNMNENLSCGLLILTFVEQLMNY